MDAGIQMRDFVCSCTVSLLETSLGDPAVVCDTNYLEQSSGIDYICFWHTKHSRNYKDVSENN